MTSVAGETNQVPSEIMDLYAGVLLPGNIRVKHVLDNPQIMIGFPQVPSSWIAIFPNIYSI
jgi:hypothetical protein